MEASIWPKVYFVIMTGSQSFINRALKAPVVWIRICPLQLTRVINVQKPLELTETTQRLDANNELEMATHPTAMGKGFSHYHRCMLAYAYIHPDSRVGSYWTDFDDARAQL